MRGTVAIGDVSDPITQLVESEAERGDSDKEEGEGVSVGGGVSVGEQVCECGRVETSSDRICRKTI